MATLDKVYFTTPDRIKEEYQVNGLVDEKLILPSLKLSVNQIRLVIGTLLLDALRTKLKNALTVVSATNANPMVITTSTNHGLTTGESVGIMGAKGNEDVNGYYEVTVTGPTTFSINQDGSAFTASYKANTAKVVKETTNRFEMILRLQAFHELLAIRGMMPTHAVKIANAGIEQVAQLGAGSEANVKAAPERSVQALASYFQTQSNLQEKYVLALICDYPTEFPEYCSSSSPIEPRARGGSSLVFFG